MTLPTVSSAPDIIADVPAPNPPLIAPNIAPDSKPLANPSKTTFLLSLMLLLNFYYKAMRSASLINFLVLISVVIIWIHYQFIFLHIFSFFAKKTHTPLILFQTISIHFCYHARYNILAIYLPLQCIIFHLAGPPPLLNIILVESPSFLVLFLIVLLSCLLNSP